MKKKMFLMVYDAEKRNFIQIDFLNDITDIQKAQVAFNQDKTPWKIVALCDKDEDVVLSFCMDDLYRGIRNSKKIHKTRKYLGYLARHDVKLGCFSVKYEDTYSNLIKDLLKIIHSYDSMRSIIGKKVAKHIFKESICELYEYARVLSTQLHDNVSPELKHAYVIEKYVNQPMLKCEFWRETKASMQRDFEEACHNLYLKFVKKFLQEEKKEPRYLMLDYRAALVDIKEEILESHIKKLETELSQEQKRDYKKELRYYLNEKNIESYWLWLSFLMSREKYPKAREGLDDIISDEELYEEAISGHVSIAALDTKYFSHACKISHEEAAELHRKYTLALDNDDTAEKMKLEELVSRRVYYGHLNLVRRYAFIKEYHEIIFGTYKEYLKFGVAKKSWT